MMKLLAIFALALSGLLYSFLAFALLYRLYDDGWDGWREALAPQPWDGWAILVGGVVTATILLGIGLSLLGNNSRR